MASATLAEFSTDSLMAVPISFTISFASSSMSKVSLPFRDLRDREPAPDGCRYATRARFEGQLSLIKPIPKGRLLEFAFSVNYLTSEPNSLNQ